MPIAHTKRGPIEYRLEGSGPNVALLLYGGHTNVNTHLGEGYFTDRRYRVLVVSRPGYGSTPVSTGPTPDTFADALNELFEHLQVKRAVVVGISAGGRTAMRFAAKYPALVEKLILQSSISFAPWPDLLTRIGTYAGLNPVTEKLTWALMRTILKRNPRGAIKMMIANLTTLDPEQVVRGLTSHQMQELGREFALLASGRGFLLDIRTTHHTAVDVAVPTLIIHSKYDKSVPVSHAQLLAKQIKGSQLFLSEAETHMIWFSSHYVEIEQVMDQFLAR